MGVRVRTAVFPVSREIQPEPAERCCFLQLSIRVEVSCFGNNTSFSYLCCFFVVVLRSSTTTPDALTGAPLWSLSGERTPRTRCPSSTRGPLTVPPCTWRSLRRPPSPAGVEVEVGVLGEGAAVAPLLGKVSVCVCACLSRVFSSCVCLSLSLFRLKKDPTTRMHATSRCCFGHARVTPTCTRRGDFDEPGFRVCRVIWNANQLQI